MVAEAVEIAQEIVDKGTKPPVRHIYWVILRVMQFTQVPIFVLKTNN